MFKSYYKKLSGDWALGFNFRIWNPFDQIVLDQQIAISNVPDNRGIHFHISLFIMGLELTICEEGDNND